VPNQSTGKYLNGHLITSPEPRKVQYFVKIVLFLVLPLTLAHTNLLCTSVARSGLQAFQSTEGRETSVFEEVGAHIVSFSRSLGLHFSEDNRAGAAAPPLCPKKSKKDSKTKSLHVFASSTTSSKLSIEDKARSVATGDPDIVCIEFTRGKRRVYRKAPSSLVPSSGGTLDNIFFVHDDAVTSGHHLGNIVADYLLPQGYPNTVAPQYAKYMGWRGVQYFFGGLFPRMYLCRHRNKKPWMQ